MTYRAHLRDITYNFLRSLKFRDFALHCDILYWSIDQLKLGCLLETTFDELTVGKSRIEAPVSLGFKLLPIISAFAGPTYRYELSKENEKSLNQNSSK